MPNRGLTVVVERTIIDIKACVEHVLSWAVLDLIVEMPEDEVRDRLEDKIEELKILSDKIGNTLGNSEENIVKIKSINSKIKISRYWKKGYCRNKAKCLWSHEESDCKIFIHKGFCGDRSYKNRHRRVCRYWAQGGAGCFRGDSCQFLHKTLKN